MCEVVCIEASYATQNTIIVISRLDYFHHTLNGELNICRASMKKVVLTVFKGMLI